MTGSGFGDGCVVASVAISAETATAWLIAVVLLLRRRSLGHDPFGLTGLLEEAATFREGGIGVGAALSGGRHRVAVALQLGQGELALLEAGAGLLDGRLGDLEAAGVLVALGRQLVERPLELLLGAAGAAVGAADRRLEPVAKGTLVTRQIAQLMVMDRGRRPEESLGREPGQLGHDLVGERRVDDRLAVVDELDGALRARERLFERPDLLAVLLVLLEFDGDQRARIGRCAPRADRLELHGRARRAAGDRELESALDGRFAGLVRSTDDRQARRKADVERPVAADVAAVQAADPHSETS